MAQVYVRFLKNAGLAHLALVGREAVLKTECAQLRKLRDDDDERYVTLLASNNELLDVVIALTKAKGPAEFAAAFEALALILDEERPDWNAE